MQQSEVELQVSSQTFTPASLVQRNDTLVAYNAGVVEMCVFIARIQAWYNYSMLLRNDVHVGLPVYGILMSFLHICSQYCGAMHMTTMCHSCG